MKKLLRSLSILLCLCLLLSVGAMAAGTGKVCTVKEGDMMFTLPEGLQKLSQEESKALFDQDLLAEMMDAMLYEFGADDMDVDTQILAGVTSQKEEDDHVYLGMMFKVSDLEMDDDLDYSALDDEVAGILNTLYEAVGDEVSEMLETEVKMGLWKNEQTYYTRIRYQIPVDELTFWGDGYATVKNGELYVYVFVTDQKEKRTLGEEIMKTMVIERHAYYPGGFPDLKDHWAAKNAVKAVDLGLFKGNTATEFAPDDAMTRAMLVQVLYRMQDSPEAGSSRFSDVAEDAWYAKAVNWASENGIVKGAGGKFDPDGLLTREQLAAILWRYAKFEGRDVSVGEDTNILSYDDAMDISSYAMMPMQWACGEGLIKGASGKLMPQDTTTRAQVATILVRYLAA